MIFGKYDLCYISKRALQFQFSNPVYQKALGLFEQGDCKIFQINSGAL